MRKMITVVLPGRVVFLSQQQVYIGIENLWDRKVFCPINLLIEVMLIVALFSFQCFTITEDFPYKPSCKLWALRAGSGFVR